MNYQKVIRQYQEQHNGLAPYDRVVLNSDYRFSDEVWDSEHYPYGHVYYQPAWGECVVLVGWFVLAAYLCTTPKKTKPTIS